MIRFSMNTIEGNNNHNIISYVKENMATFEEKPFSEVDSLVLSWLAYLSIPKNCDRVKTWDGMALKDLFLIENFPKLIRNTVWPEETIALLGLVSASPRFRDIKVFHHRDDFDIEKEKQFAAMTYQLQPELLYVAFRGTDTSFTGWKEDMYISLTDPIPSQTASVEYLNEVGAMCPERMIIGGHSKGGNLAVYAAAGCRQEVQGQIVKVFSHDGPSFPADVMKAMNMDKISYKIRKTIPQSSMVGMIFEDEKNCQIIKSDAFGPMQHNPFTWRVEHENFCYEEELTPDAKYMYRTFNKWINSLDYEEREKMIRLFFRILEATGETDFVSLVCHMDKNLPVMMKELIHIDEHTRMTMFHIMKELAKSSVSTAMPCQKQAAM